MRLGILSERVEGRSESVERKLENPILQMVYSTLQYIYTPPLVPYLGRVSMPNSIEVLAHIVKAAALYTTIQGPHSIRPAAPVRLADRLYFTL